jgi:transcriptional regulator with XRE-family HTH domain
MITLDHHIGLRVNELRQALDLTLHAAALKANLKVGELARIEQGIGELPDAKLIRLARSLGVSPGYLLGTEEHDELEADPLYRLFKSHLAACKPDLRRSILVMLIQGVAKAKKQGLPGNQT